MTNLRCNNVTKLPVSAGTNLGPSNVGMNPIVAPFDGAKIFVANEFSNTVSKL